VTWCGAGARAVSQDAVEPVSEPECPDYFTGSSCSLSVSAACLCSTHSRLRHAFFCRHLTARSALPPASFFSVGVGRAVAAQEAAVEY
jgi:hypothetical protein